MEDEPDAILMQIDVEKFLSFESSTFDLRNGKDLSCSSCAFELPHPATPPTGGTDNQLHPAFRATSSRFPKLTTDNDVEEAKKRPFLRTQIRILVGAQMVGSNGVLKGTKSSMHFLL